ncbi:ankyrin repeat domain-containing protein [Stenotrophomonas sp.]|uniref:ankyrin repeat domain-containing protein n=1 Tax=Stenotrophomonas sp. TaxID=69392 RepID=UPI0028A72638|nr:ankyrin repeat domain-containing protein [Stenotrophomonas sp.]
MIPDDQRLKETLSKFADEYTFEGYILTAPESPGVCGDTPLHVAAMKNKVDLLSEMMPYVTNVDVAGDMNLTPMAAAAMFGNVEAAGYLLSCGADPFIRDEFGDLVLDKMKLKAGFEELVASIESGRYKEAQNRGR